MTHLLFGGLSIMQFRFPGILAPRFQQRFADYAADKRGAAAVEFAMISIPFFFLIFGLLEVCMLFIMSTVLEHSVTEASRAIRTGQAQQSSMTDSDFRQIICDKVFGLLDCNT